MEKRYFLLGIGLLIIVCAVVLRLIAPHNRWTCVDGTWQKQGHPLTDKPSDICFDNFSVEKEAQVLSSLFADEESSSAPPQPLSSASTTVASSSVPVVRPTEKEVVLISPQTDELLRSPYRVYGRARGSWFFEGSLPVVLQTKEGELIVNTYAQAEEDWMTSDWVNFSVDLTFNNNDSREGVLIIKKDNPSGLPENEAELAFPVRLGY